MIQSEIIVPVMNDFPLEKVFWAFLALPELRGEGGDLVLFPGAFRGPLLIDAPLPYRLRPRKQEGFLQLLKRRTSKKGIFFHCLEHKESYLAPDIQGDPFFSPLFEKTRSALGVPVAFEGMVIGALYVESAGRALKEKDLKQIETFCAGIALPLTKACFKMWAANQGRYVSLEGFPLHVLRKAVQYALWPCERILLEGPTGAGKEMIADFLFFLMGRPGQTVRVDCSTLTPSLIESLLFGHRKGAYTGADREHRGFFKVADHGSILLDEIIRLPIEVQGPFLRVVETGEFFPLGESEKIEKVDTFMVTAANEEMKKLVGQGRFLPDLYARLARFVIRLPPIHLDPEGLKNRVYAAMERIRRQKKRPDIGIEPDALDAILCLEFPHNMRDVYALLENTLIVNGETITKKGILEGAMDMGLERVENTEGRYERAVRRTHRGMIIRALEIHEGNRAQAAEWLGIDSRKLYRYISELNLPE